MDAVIKMAVNVGKEKSVLSYIIMFAAFIVAYFFNVNVVFVILACAAVGIIATAILMTASTITAATPACIPLITVATT